MEMKSFANDRVGPTGETAAPKKIARKSTGAVRNKDTKYGPNHKEPMAFEVYEVIGNIQDHCNAIGLTAPAENPKNKGCNDEPYPKNKDVLVSMRKSKDPPNKSTEQKFLDLACMMQAEKAKKKKHMQILDLKPPLKSPYATITTNNMIIGEAPRPSVESTNTGVKVDKKYFPGVEDCGYINFHGNKETVTGSFFSLKMEGNNDNKIKNENLALGFSLMEVREVRAVGGKIDGVLEASGIGMKIESPAPEENAKKNTKKKEQEGGKDVLDKAPDEVLDKVLGEGPRKVPIEVRSKVPGEGPKKVPTEVRGKVPGEGPKKVPTEVRGKVPGEGPKKVPTEVRGKVPEEDPRSVPIEVRGKVSGEGPKKVPTEVKGKVPTEVRGKVAGEGPKKVPTEVGGKVPEEDPRSVPTEVRGKVPGESPSTVSIEVKSKVPEKIPGDRIVQGGGINLSNDFEEVVVSSGFAWGNDDQPRTEYYDTTGSIDDDEDEDGVLIGELKINETGCLEFVKRFKGDTVAENGTSVEIREGKLVEKTGEGDKGAIQDEEIGSVAGEVTMEEGNKRKRIRKGEETKKLNPKKRKVEKSKKNNTNGFGDGKDKGKSQGGRSSRKDSAKPGSSICDQSTLEETIDRVASGHLSLPFLENLRGEIKSLSRADLEELIVQKLCEAITERSTVGDLRKRAEALERNQERWKDKVVMLTKQIKEMDLVMKNYMNEVRKHHADKSCQMISPIRVTRSVGLQVSFTTTPSKLAMTMPQSSGDTHHGREKAGRHSNRSVHVSEPPNKNIPILPTTSYDKPLVIDSINKFSTKSGLTITLQPVSSSSEAQLASKPIPIQPKLSILPATDLPTTSLIDLTVEDDRHMGGSGPVTTQQTLTVGPPGQVKVVNHIHPAQSSVGAVTLLISNAASPTCCSSTTITPCESQNRQLAIPGSSTQLTQRHILPAISTLIYKPNTLMQPGSQGLTSKARSSAAKPTKHPAPLPPFPTNQIHKPNWKLIPPRPSLKLSKGDTGIVLSWNTPLGPEYETVVSYQLFAYQESDCPPCSSLWKRVGEIKALRPPMACTLSHFLHGYVYHFSVRAVDIHSRVGPFSVPGRISLIP